MMLNVEELSGRMEEIQKAEIQCPLSQTPEADTARQLAKVRLTMQREKEANAEEFLKVRQSVADLAKTLQSKTRKENIQPRHNVPMNMCSVKDSEQHASILQEVRVDAMPRLRRTPSHSPNAVP